ncbi:uncharacterized protein HD556DRAFT_1310388 [Suillus plorans]|uniref:Uncharacterized protein n=1 Tax=Suillus plorans TaxID=116603 RepID=A0A9P7AJQ9_9AGAM|nr:uncharacterized protein HD556DRAFT_1310388 [Suillus plorans]KAG1790852.1 hypothetical protein HD556DRAFT_1310388 [Suillus plorans]
MYNIKNFHYIYFVTILTPVNFWSHFVYFVTFSHTAKIEVSASAPAQVIVKCLWLHLQLEVSVWILARARAMLTQVVAYHLQDDVSLSILIGSRAILTQVVAHRSQDVSPSILIGSRAILTQVVAHHLQDAILTQVVAHRLQDVSPSILIGSRAILTQVVAHRSHLRQQWFQFMFLSSLFALDMTRQILIPTSTTHQSPQVMSPAPSCLDDPFLSLSNFTISQNSLLSFDKSFIVLCCARVLLEPSRTIITQAVTTCRITRKHRFRYY